mgnify:CR=1 FL=1
MNFIGEGRVVTRQMPRLVYLLPSPVTDIREYKVH